MSPREITSEEISDFIKAHHPCDAWRSDGTNKWVNWMLAHGCLDAFTDDGNKISVVISTRRTTKENAENDFDINTEGDCVAIDLIVSDCRHKPFLLSAIGQFVLAKHGMPESVHWKRTKNAPKTVSAEHLASRLNLLP